MRHRAPELVVALLILGWRFITRDPLHIWKDWLAVLALLWIFLVLVQRPRAALIGVLATGSYLSGLYIWGQYPHTLYTLGLAP